jgi:hypothetical protein
MRVENISNDSDTAENTPQNYLREICQVLGHSKTNQLQKPNMFLVTSFSSIN